MRPTGKHDGPRHVAPARCGIASATAVRIGSGTMKRLVVLALLIACRNTHDEPRPSPPPAAPAAAPPAAPATAPPAAPAPAPATTGAPPAAPRPIAGVMPIAGDFKIKDFAFT